MGSAAGRQVMATTVTVLGVSAVERAAGRFAPASLAAAATALRADGVVVLENAMEPTTLAWLAARMETDLPRAMAAAEARWGGVAHNFVWGNVQQGPVLGLPGFCDAEVIANPWALQLRGAVMRRPTGQGLRGPGFSSGETGNTHLGRGSRTQPVLRDVAHDAPPLTTFVLNYPLSDVDEANGALEIWPGATTTQPHPHNHTPSRQHPSASASFRPQPWTCSNHHAPWRPPNLTSQVWGVSLRRDAPRDGDPGGGVVAARALAGERAPHHQRGSEVGCAPSVGVHEAGGGDRARCELLASGDGFGTERGAVHARAYSGRW